MGVAGIRPPQLGQLIPCNIHWNMPNRNKSTKLWTILCHFQRRETVIRDTLSYGLRRVTYSRGRRWGRSLSQKSSKLHQKWGKSDFFVFFTIVRLERWGYDPSKTLSNEAVQTKKIRLNCRHKINCVIEGGKCINIVPPPVVSFAWKEEMAIWVYEPSKIWFVPPPPPRSG